MFIRKKHIWILTFSLIAFEQGIKLIINKYYQNVSIAIIEPYIYFKPVFNRDYSWFNSMLQLGAGKWLHIFIVSLMITLIYLFYRFLNKQLNTAWLIDTAFIFIFSGAICSLIDKVFWNGSLDYIAIKGLFTFDLKDVYINIFTAFLILMVLTNYKGFKEKKDTELIKGFISYILRK